VGRGVRRSQLRVRPLADRPQPIRHPHLVSVPGTHCDENRRPSVPRISSARSLRDGGGRAQIEDVIMNDRGEIRQREDLMDHVCRWPCRACRSARNRPRPAPAWCRRNGRWLGYWPGVVAPAGEHHRQCSWPARHRQVASTTNTPRPDRPTGDVGPDRYFGGGSAGGRPTSMSRPPSLRACAVRVASWACAMEWMVSSRAVVRAACWVSSCSTMSCSATGCRSRMPRSLRASTSTPSISCSVRRLTVRSCSRTATRRGNSTSDSPIGRLRVGWRAVYAARGRRWR
jgi:hypothetical protein